jgi:hypothetical protein
MKEIYVVFALLYDGARFYKKNKTIRYSYMTKMNEIFELLLIRLICRNLVEFKISDRNNKLGWASCCVPPAINSRLFAFVFMSIFFISYHSILFFSCPILCFFSFPFTSSSPFPLKSLLFSFA